MAIARSIPRSRRLMSIRGRMMVDTVRGVVRVRKWPRKRGPPKSAAQRYWVDWFTQANLLAKYADPASQRYAIEASAGTGRYPRDILLALMRGRLFWWVDQDGWRWHSMAAIGDISASLDILAQTVGDVLVRATDRWRSPVAGDPGDVLTVMGAGLAPEWQPVAGAGGFSGGALCLRSASFVIGNGVQMAVPYDLEAYDTAGIHDPATNPTRLTVPVGTTWVRLHSNLRLPGVYNFDIQNWKNGAAIAGGGYYQSTAAVHMNAISAVVPCVAGDYFEQILFNHSGAARTIPAQPDYPFFSMELL